MGLDKLKKKKKKKKPNQLVSKRKDGKRPGYYGSDEGFGDYDDSPSSNGSSGDNGGGYDYEYAAYNPPSPEPSPEPSYSVQDDLTDYATNVGSTASVGGGFEDDSDDIQDDLTDYATNVMKTADPKGGFEDDGDTGDSLYVSPTRIMKEQEPYIDYKPGPNTVTAEELSNLNKGIGDADEQAATLAKIQAFNPIEKTGFFDRGIGKLIKNTATIAAPFVAPALLPASLAKGYTTYNQARFFGNIPNRLGLTDKTLPTLTQLVKNIPQGTGNRVPDTATGYESSGDDRPIPKDIISANVQKFTPKQINSLQSNISLLESVLDSGQYRGTKLNSSQLSQVSNQRNSLLEQYNMIQEYLV
tara:strand:+ start:1064 stop:2134 length:1071 start_codon:yes stop_codon:yes gene_type:complete